MTQPCNNLRHVEDALKKEFQLEALTIAYTACFTLNEEGKPEPIPQKTKRYSLIGLHFEQSAGQAEQEKGQAKAQYTHRVYFEDQGLSQADMEQMRHRAKELISELKPSQRIIIDIEHKPSDREIREAEELDKMFHASRRKSMIARLKYILTGS